MDEAVHLGGPVPDAIDEVVVAHDGGDGGAQARRGRDQRLGDAGRDDRQAGRALGPMPWNAAMMPHTVPKRPMKGVALAVVARNGKYRSSRRHLESRRPGASRDAPPRAARRGAPRRRRRCTWSTTLGHARDLVIGGEVELSEGALAELACRAVHHRGRRPSRNTLRNSNVCRRTRRSCHHFSTISAHDTTENSSSTPRTNFATGPAFKMSSKMPDVMVSAVANEAPLRLPRSYVAVRRTVNVLTGLFAALHAGPAPRWRVDSHPGGPV